MVSKAEIRLLRVEATTAFFGLCLHDYILNKAPTHCRNIDRMVYRWHVPRRNGL